MLLFVICYWYVDKKSVRFRSIQFDSLRFWTTYILQIYARKTHAINASVHKPYLKNIDVLKVSSFQTIKFGLITLYKYVVMGNTLPNRVQRYNKICGCANFVLKKF